MRIICHIASFIQIEVDEAKVGYDAIMWYATDREWEQSVFGIVNSI